MNAAGPTLRSQLLGFGALVLVSASIVTAFFVVPIMAVQAKIDEPGEYGVCNGVAPTCHDVPLETIADASGLDFPTGSVVASSSAAPSSFTAIDYLQAVISVAEGSMPPERSSTCRCPRASTSRPSDRHSRSGAPSRS
jgi:hypothetical protein